ncbi:TonB-dependent receptor family protein [Nevskia sp.]|uniref:TonB-dependent receptor family protein n=1 Tax=Nevskia sp. TaxID=1929292 RepID=UPI003F6FC8EA
MPTFPRQRPIPLAAALFAAGALLAGPAGAQERAADAPKADSGSDEAVALTPVLVEGTFVGAIENTAGTARQLTAEELDRLRPVTLQEALRAVPGLRIIDDDIAGRRSGIGLRGAPSRRSRKVLLLEDGVPINASPYLDSSAHYTPPFQRLENIEVLQGTGHVIYGPLNNHGIINFRSLSPTVTPQTKFEIGYGNDDNAQRHLSHTRTIGDFGIALAYTGASADGAFDVEKSRFDDFYGEIEYRINDRHSLEFSASHLRERSNYDESNLTPVEYALAPRRKLGRFGQEYNTIGVNFSKYDLKHQFNGSGITVSSRIYATRTDRARFTVDPDEISVDALPAFEYEDPDYQFVEGVSGVMVSRARLYENYGAESRAVVNFSTGSIGHELSFGVQGTRSLFDDGREFGDVGEVISIGRRGTNFGTNDLAAARLDKYQATAIAGYLQNAVQFGDVQITPGLRIEHYTQHRERRFTGSTFNFDGEQDDRLLALPSLALLYTGFDKTQVFANVARGYTPAFARSADEFPLKPETGINSQIGFRTRLAPGLNAEVAAFYNVIYDTVVQLPYTVDDANVVVNAADSRSVGFDLGLNYETPSLPGTSISAFSQLAYSYARSTFTEGDDIDGNRVPETPLHAGSLTIGLKGGALWTASLTVNHFGSYFSDLLNTRDLALANEDREPVQAGDSVEIREVVVLGRVPSNTLLSARIGVTVPWVSPNTELWVTGRNLTDKTYIVDIENGIRPGAARTVIGGVTIRF